MAKKEDPIENEEVAIQPIDLGVVHTFTTDLTEFQWEKIREEIAPQGVTLETNELIDQKFTLVSMKRFTSRFPGQPYAYYVIGKTKKDNDLFNTVIGGAQPIQCLDAIYDAGIKNPIEFILSWHDGGQYGGYYTLD
jgi:hypothetical protein